MATTVKKHLKELRNILFSAGYRIGRETTNSHRKFYVTHENGFRCVYTAAITPSDHNASKQFFRVVRRVTAININQLAHPS